MAHRPLSPHLTVYRFAYTMAMSIFHRITGLALTAGSIVLVLWLAALAGGEAHYELFLSFAGSWFFKALLAMWTVAFVYHFANGIRHLFWDAGLGLERAQARLSGRVVMVAVILVTLLLFALMYGKVTS